MENPSSATPMWETSKENVKPLRRGRNVESLNKALVLSEKALPDSDVRAKHKEEEA